MSKSALHGFERLLAGLPKIRFQLKINAVLRHERGNLMCSMFRGREIAERMDRINL